MKKESEGIQGFSRVEGEEPPAILVENLSKHYLPRRKGKGPTSNPVLNDLLALLNVPLPFLGRGKKRFHLDNTIRAVDDVSFAVARGERLGIIGRNGAGKTTLLKVLARATAPTAGRVVMRGRVASLLELGLGFRDDLTGRENVLLAGTMYGLEKSFVEERLPRVAEFSELGEFFDQPVKIYSSGMYLRLAFSTVVNMDPDIILADEVLAVGDLAFQERCFAHVAGAGALGQTVLFVSHDMEAVRSICSRALWLDRGKIVKIGEPDEVIDSYVQSARGGFPSASQPIPPRAGGRESRTAPPLAIRSVRLLSEELKEVGALAAGRDSFVEIELETRAGDVCASVGVDFLHGRVIVLRTISPEDLVVAEPSRVRIRVKVPRHLLAELDYELDVGLLVHAGGEEHVVGEKRALSFRVYGDPDNQPRSRWPTARLPGLVQPRLEWTVERTAESQPGTAGEGSSGRPGREAPAPAETHAPRAVR